MIRAPLNATVLALILFGLVCLVPLFFHLLTKRK
jgi:hypothetical protein